MMAGTLAITGVGIVDVFGFAGFYSKDSILEAAYGRALALDTLPSSWASLRLC
jgi:NADH-quinone oxidoreductase subunit L